MLHAVKAALLRARTLVHRKIFQSTNGRVLARWGGLPVVMLTTTGRRSGLARTTMLVSPLQDGDRVVIVASNGGAAEHPQWFLNLSEKPDVDVVTGGRRHRMHARVASVGERERLWPRLVAGSPSYGRYQARTTREIPLVLLEPVDL